MGENGQKKLMRMRNQKKLLGVCEGLGIYFNIDPVILRVAFVVAAFMASTGFWLYVLAAVIMPGCDDIIVNGAKPLRRVRGTGIFGVCGGIAKYVDADVTVVRLIMVGFAIFGIGVLFYVVSAILIPSEKNA